MLAGLRLGLSVATVKSKQHRSYFKMSAYQVGPMSLHTHRIDTSVLVVRVHLESKAYLKRCR